MRDASESGREPERVDRLPGDAEIHPAETGDVSPGPGLGFSSLAYLRQFPLDFVKIDGSFVHGLRLADGEDAIVAAIVGLSHALGLFTVAEGVETQRQRDSLRSLGCDRAQGFLFARAGSPAMVDELITAGVRGDG